MYKSARHFVVKLSHYQHSLLFHFMNASLPSKKHFRLSNALTEKVGGFCLYAWPVELQMVAMNITMADSYGWVKNINLWNILEIEIQFPYYPIEVLDLFFQGKGALRSTCGSTIWFSWKWAELYWTYSFKFNNQKKNVLHTLCANAMLSTRDTQIYENQPCYWGVHIPPGNVHLSTATLL